MECLRHNQPQRPYKLYRTTIATGFGAITLSLLRHQVHYLTLLKCLKSRCLHRNQGTRLRWRSPGKSKQKGENLEKWWQLRWCCEDLGWAFTTKSTHQTQDTISHLFLQYFQCPQWVIDREQYWVHTREWSWQTFSLMALNSLTKSNRTRKQSKKSYIFKSTVFKKKKNSMIWDWIGNLCKVGYV